MAAVLVGVLLSSMCGAAKAASHKLLSYVCVCVVRWPAAQAAQTRQ